MKKPKMILFDYGQTLIYEEKFDALRGNQAVLDQAVSNPHGITALKLQQLADELNEDIIQSFGVSNRNHQNLELSNEAFDHYLYESFDVKFPFDYQELEWIFWSHAAPGHPTEHIKELLSYLQKESIRTGVVSNMMNSSNSLARRINEILPFNQFEFILSSSDYLFRKPHKRIFELALRKARLTPEEIWFCGDNLICDVQGSYQAGMKPIWYPTYIDCDYKVTTQVPYLTITDWELLIDQLKRCE